MLLTIELSMEKYLIASLPVLFLPLCTLAAPNPCNTQRNTAEMDECQVLTLKIKDEELNSAYQNLLKSLAPETSDEAANYSEIRKQLQLAQRAWMQFRDADCTAKYLFYIDGTIRNTIELSCKIDKTVKRTKELTDWIKN